MVFAKTLLVTFLLCLTNFGENRRLKHHHGEGHRLKTPNNTFHRKAAPPPVPGIVYYAENYRGFLLFMLREIWETDGPIEIGNAVPAGHPAFDKKGVYFIFWTSLANYDDSDNQDQIYPVYVGITGRTFAQRFTEHINRDTGVIHRIKNTLWPTTGNIHGLTKVIVYLIDVPLPVAKFLESTFLAAFDFAMNTEENQGLRTGLEQDDAEEARAGYKRFVDVQEELLKYITDFNKDSELSNIQHQCNIETYNFP